ncbi:hypothetical protein DYU05_15185 [Mucilaginibacter terrenus]|uniref:Uncharacterized protein n=1 Tax=Mucilaginibacter terrenus TaxID=2482727 RepID=A0A3E2NRA6_9SPHI|nr:hypothetical protein [Mucilaginibacter terrenus]RFZ83471.1 hypothetical protein DYU05_15185 [Mucilaginibacter terrenus]
MKTFSPYLFLCAILLFFQSCSPDVGAWKNDQIKSGKREDLQELNNKVFAMMKKGDHKGLEDVISKELLENGNFYALAGNIGHRMVVDSFTRFEEYYTINKYIGYDTITAADKTNPHKLIFLADAEEMYIAMFTPVNKKQPDQEMITATFANYNYGWKLASISIGKFTFNGKTAQELYIQAKKSYQNHYTVDALHQATLAVTALSPSEIWQYKNDAEIKEFYRQVADDANKLYKFPLIVEEVSTKPRIIGFYNKSTGEGSFPIISYLSHIPFKDTAGISYENMQVRKAINKLMPGLNKNNRYVYYLAYNKSPNTTENVDRRELADKHW